MEIEFNDVSLKDKNKYLVKNLNLKIPDKEIIGIINDKNNILKRILVDNLEIQGNVNYKDAKIGYVNNRDFLTKSVSDEFYLIKNKTLDKKNYIEKILLAIKMVGLTDDYLEREINTLSKTEKKLVELALNLIINPDIIILDNFFNNLDGKTKLNIKKIILELKRTYNKTVIVIDNINILYELCNHFIVFKDDYLLISGNRENVFDIDLFRENDLEIPFFIEFSNEAKAYNKKIKYYQDINDLLKGVYKNAR